MITSRKSQKGFSLLEVLVSIVIFGVVSMGMAVAFVTNLKTNTASEVRSQASEIAQRYLDELRTVDPGSLPSSGTTGPQTFTLGKRSYAVLTTYCADASLCASSTMRHLRIRVQYQNREVYRVDTVFSQLR